jgi:hypothetical protein
MENVQALLAIELFVFVGEPRPALHSEQKVKQHTPVRRSVYLTALSTSARQPLRTDRCQPQIVRNFFVNHTL